MNKFEDFITLAPMPESLTEKYSGVLPDEVLDIWRTHGLGIFRSGYFRVINPDDYLELVDECYAGLDPIIPVFTTGMGDIIAWQGEYFVSLNYRYGLIGIMGSPRLLFHLLDDDDYIQDELSWAQYPQACQLLGVPAYEECFGYVPILGAGGPERVENIQRVQMKTHIQVITAFMGPLDRYKLTP